MPASDAPSVGRLKFKGANTGAGIEKKKKKKKQVKTEQESLTHDTPDEQRSTSKDQEDHEQRSGSADVASRGKTEAEKRFDEIRRKRMMEKFQKEGIKSHKDRMDDFNKQLSELSDYHDMPKIGPG